MDTQPWKEGYYFALKLALLCITLSITLISAFSGKWLTFLGCSFIGVGCVCLYLAYRLKSKYLSNSSTL